MSNSNTNWLFWRGGQNVAEWGFRCGQELSSLLALLVPSKPSEGGVRVLLELPTADAAQSAQASNSDLMGCVRVSLADFDGADLKLSIPLPFHGVFARRSTDGPRGVLYVWAPWFGEAPGFRYIRPTAAALRDKVFWRMGLPGGYYVQAPCEALNEKQAARMLPKRMPWISDDRPYPEWVRPSIEEFSPVLPVKSAASARAFWNEIHENAVKRFQVGIGPVTDEDDLDHRALMAFPVWLRFRLCDLLVRRIWFHATEFLEAKNHSQRADVLGRVWKAVCAEASILEQQLLPFSALLRSGRLHHCAPLNPADMASLLTQISRSGARRGTLEMLPAEFRQNHPSFRGRICPVQTPESALVGLSLNLARGAMVAPDGQIHASTTGVNSSAELGYSACLIPFYQHNDCARSMMGAKNLRQAVSVKGRKRAAVRTGDESSVSDFVQPLIDCDICPAVTDDSDSMALGADVLVAYMPWMGLNFEDAIVVSEQLVNSGTFDVEIEKQVRKEFAPGWAPCGTLRHTLFKEEVDGLAPEGTALRAGSLIASLGKEGDAMSSPIEIRYLDHSPALLKSIRFDRGAPWIGGVLKYVLVKRIPLRIGDKLMGRHGNKGVVGAVLPANQMPRLPDDPSLPPAMRGRTIDVVLNPHGVISRMNLGQLIETHVGWLLHSGIPEDKLLPADAIALGHAFSSFLNHDKVRTLLGQTGLTAEGKIRLDLPSGQKTCSPVVVGFQHIVRLRHIPELKAQARRGGVGARYSRSSGQAVHSRDLGGGQRLGEMEVWALAAHGVERLLAESLGIRADANLSKKWEQDSDRAPASDLPTGFAERLRDWLRALLIDLKVTDNVGTLSLLSADAAQKLIGPGREVRSGDELKKLISARFSCDRTRGGIPCGFSVLDGESIAVEGGEAFRSDKTLTFGEILAHLRLEPAAPLQVSEHGYILPLLDALKGKPSGSVAIQIEAKKDQVKAIARPGEGGERPKRWPKAFQQVFLYGRFSKAKSVNATADEIVAAFAATGGQWQVTDMRVTCPEHKTVPVRSHPPYAEVYRGVPGGLCDSGLFGELQSAGREDGPPGWGFIRLPVDIDFPVDVFLGDKWESVLSSAGRSKTDIPPIRILPVLPLRYRFPSDGKRVPREVRLIRWRYQQILSAALRYQKADSDGRRQATANSLSKYLRGLFKVIVDGLSGKEGRIRHEGLGRRVDRTARMVITPNPDLSWDQAGVPTAVLLELCGDEIGRWLDEKQASRDLFDRIAASPYTESARGQLAEWRWMRSGKDESVLTAAHAMLTEFYRQHPNRVVLLNRQPSLHRDSFQAFHPVPLPPSAGDVIQLCPLACKGFGADFDGDEMVIHVPVSQSAQDEATRLLPSRNTLSLAAGDVMADFDQDVVLGTYWLTYAQDEWRAGFKALFPGNCCQALIPGQPMTKKESARLLSHLALCHPQEAPGLVHKWMRMAFDSCTQMGVSFGFYDVLHLKTKVGDLEDALGAEIGEVNEKVQEQVEAALGQCLAGIDFSAPGLHFAAMALSGARGRGQARQLVGARAFLSPGAIAFDDPASRFLFREALVEGMPPEVAFYSAMNSRSSMCDKKLGTRQAGYLTRRLATALWHYNVSATDCGIADANRSVLTCMAQEGCCATCYGPLPNGTAAQIGFPAGLIAAQSIGERGTQLSMQSFHTGKKVFSIRDALDILESRIPPSLFGRVEDAPLFLGEMRKSEAYRNLRSCHFEVLWRVIHDSPDRSLRSVIESLPLFARVSFERQAKHLLLGALAQEQDRVDRPPANVLFNRFSVESEAPSEV